MHKREFIEALVKEKDNGIETKAAATRAVNAVAALVKKTVKKGGVVQLMGFGTFKPAKRGARTCRNPHTGEPVKVKAKKVVKFKPSKNFLS